MAKHRARLSADTEKGWLVDNLKPEPHELCIEEDTGAVKLGDGELRYSDLPKFSKVIRKTYLEWMKSDKPIPDGAMAVDEIGNVLIGGRKKWIDSAGLFIGGRIRAPLLLIYYNGSNYNFQIVERIVASPSEGNFFINGRYNIMHSDVYSMGFFFPYPIEEHVYSNYIRATLNVQDEGNAELFSTDFYIAPSIQECIPISGVNIYPSYASGIVTFSDLTSVIDGIDISNPIIQLTY